MSSTAANATVALRHQLHTLYVKIFAKNERPDKSTFAWDTDGLLFVVDNSSTAIICNTRKFFTGNLTHTKIILETAEEMRDCTKLVGTVRLVLTDNTKEHHAYEITGYIFDPYSPINILGILPLGKYLNYIVDVQKSCDDDGNTIKSGATKSHFVWYHGRHKWHFIHSSSHMPEMNVFVGNGYYNYFCTCIHKFLKYKVHYAFFSAYSIEPQINKSVPPNQAIIAYDYGS